MHRIFSNPNSSLILVKRLNSTIDRSVNWILENEMNHTIETRFVQRSPYNKIISYLSSSSGCAQKCTFCFLTQNKETKPLVHINPNQYVEQAQYTLNHYIEMNKNKPLNMIEPVNRINFNFMARGEPLANKYIVFKYPEIYQRLTMLANKYSLKSKLNVSTIMPHTIRNRSLVDIFQYKPVHLYYSLWSINDQWRAKNMPGAMPFNTAFKKLLEYQENCKKHYGSKSDPSANKIFSITIHGAFIKGENDDLLLDIENMAQFLINSGLENIKFNMVRYNNHSNLNWKEPEWEQLTKIFNILNKAVGNRGNIIPRVGPDVHAPCGTFIDDLDL